MSMLVLTPPQRLFETTETERDAPDIHLPARAARQRKLALLARIQRRYQTKDQELTIGSVRLTFTCVADPDRVLDEVADEADRQERLTGNREAEPLHLPYWAELWDSALGV